MGEFIYVSIKEDRNILSIKQIGEYRILCLGGASTMGEWPKPLEEILNQRNIGVQFNVIDKGVAGTDTGAILSHLVTYISKYKPNMIITMMGINDNQDAMGLPLSTFSQSKNIISFNKSLRIYKLAKILKLNIATGITKLSGYFHEKRMAYKIVKQETSGIFSDHQMQRETPEKVKKENSQDYGEYMELGRYFRKQGEYDKAEELFKKALSINPKNEGTYFELGQCFRDQGEYDKAVELFEQAVSMNPKNEGVYFELGWCYRAKGEYEKAGELFKKVISMNSNNAGAYFELGRYYRYQREHEKAEELFDKALAMNSKNDGMHIELGKWYMEQGEYEKAEELFEKALSINPENDMLYIRLGRYYKKGGDYDKAEELFKKALLMNPKNIETYFVLGRVYKKRGEYDKVEKLFKKVFLVSPKSDRAYLELGRCYLDQGKHDKAEELFKKAFSINPKNEEVHFELERCDREREKLDKAEEMSKKANVVNPEKNILTHGLILNQEKVLNSKNKVSNNIYEFFVPITVSNYRKVRDIAARNKIKLVCVQYPMRSVEPLKKIFEDKEGIFFVDNESVFKNALKQENYNEYFVDRFIGYDFGHCTLKGNRLLAENIADVILEEVYK
ncbi:tetratricopeptide repeat protein [Elusimicrobiota bacterium]